MEEMIIHDTGCVQVSVIGGIEGIDSRAIEYRQVDFCFGGQAPIAHEVAVGMLYLVEIDDNNNVVTTMRTPAIGNPHCSGIFLSNTGFQSDGGMQVRESQEKTEKCFYSLDVYRLQIQLLSET